MGNLWGETRGIIHGGRRKATASGGATAPVLDGEFGSALTSMGLVEKARASGSKKKAGSYGR